jgi:hypothetical protein
MAHSSLFTFLLLTFFSDETVEVGADLCEIDTEAIATVEASESTSSTESKSEPTSTRIVASSKPPSPSPSSSLLSSTGARTPSIHFLGKDGWARKLNGVEGTNVVYEIPANYGRLSFSEEEMEALIMGGANVAPEVKSYSSGATFSV